MPGNGDVMKSIRHANMFALMNYFKSNFLKSAYCSFRRKICEKQLDSHRHFSCFSGMNFFADHGEISPDRVLDTLQRFAQAVTLTNAPRQGRAFDMIAVFAFFNCDEVFYGPMSIGFCHD